MPDLRAVQVPEGSVVLLTGVELSDEDHAALVDEVERVAGHTRFAILIAPGDGEVEVWGPDVDLAEKVRRLLATERDRQAASSAAAPPVRGKIGEGELRQW